MDEIPNRANVVVYIFEKRQGFSNQTRHPLPQSAVESFNVACFSSFFAHCSMPFAR